MLQLTTGNETAGSGIFKITIQLQHTHLLEKKCVNDLRTSQRLSKYLQKNETKLSAYKCINKIQKEIWCTFP